MRPVTEFRNADWMITQGLTRVGAVSVDNPASAEDYALASDRLDTVAGQLSELGVYQVGDLDNVPSGAADTIANILALALQPDFGDRSPQGQSNIPPRAMLEDMLRRMSPGKPGYGPQQVSFM